jgi:hypothetical protein
MSTILNARRGERKHCQHGEEPALLITAFLEKAQQVSALQATLTANGRPELAQRLSRLELAIRRVQEELAGLSETPQPTNTDLSIAYDVIADLIAAVEEIMDQQGAFTDLLGNVPLVA